MNPLLADWETPFDLPPFADIQDGHFAPALDEALQGARRDTAAIAASDEPPTFANTIEALERSGRGLDRVLGVFHNLASADSNDARESLMRDVSPRLAAHANAIVMDRDLWARVEAVWSGREGLDLTPEQARVLMLTRRGFVRAGAALEGADRERLGEIKSRLATLGTRFTQNLLADERAWSMPLPPGARDDLPRFVVAAAEAAGRERGADGPVITLSRSLVVPFLQFSADRAGRERAWRAWTSRGANGGGTDNRAIAAEILALRSERARLLGYPDFASYKLETEMAGSPEAVRDLLMRVWEPARRKAMRDAEILEAMMCEDAIAGPLEPWDWRFYSERRRAAEHDLDEAALKPYLSLGRMIAAAFACANRLFGLEFRELPGAPVYHPDVRAWEVTRDGRHMAVFYGDYLARGSKRSGAWCSTFRDQRTFGGEVRPVVVNVCNFAGGDPTLLSWDDARTLFHEFGHALHQILSDVTYERVSGTSVARDFVELPSQLYEHWLEVPRVLGEFATHHETGEPMPEPLRERLLAASTYDQGFETVEYVASALVDLAFHEGDPPADPMQRQAEVLEAIGMPHAIAMRHATPHFAHVFAGDGYSAGYYSYMWSEVMDADAFRAFEEAGDPFDPETARRLEAEILSRGGSDEPEELYEAFRGRMPGPEAMLEGRGLVEA